MSSTCLRHLRGPWWTSFSLLIPFSYWDTQNEQRLPDLATSMLNRCFSWPASYTPANTAEHTASPYSPTSYRICSPSGSQGSLLQKIQPVSPLPVQTHGALAWKCDLAFTCAECLEISVGSFVQEVRRTLSSRPVFLLSSAPLNLMSSENVLRHHSVLFSKPIYVWLLYLYIGIFWSANLYLPSAHHPNRNKKISLLYEDWKENCWYIIAAQTVILN